MKKVILLFMLILYGCGGGESQINKYFTWTESTTYINKLTEIATTYDGVDCREIFIGDSRVEGGEWDQFGVCNFGLGGDTALGILTRIGSVLEKNPNTVYIQVGRNDVVHMVDHVETVLYYYDAVVSRLEDSGIYVVVTTTLPDYEPHEFYNNAIHTLNSMLNKYSPVDLSELYPDGYLIHHYDGVHLDNTGYEIWYNIMGF